MRPQRPRCLLLTSVNMWPHSRHTHSTGPRWARSTKRKDMGFSRCINDVWRVGSHVAILKLLGWEQKQQKLQWTCQRRNSQTWHNFWWEYVRSIPEFTWIYGNTSSFPVGCQDWSGIPSSWCSAMRLLCRCRGRAVKLMCDLRLAIGSSRSSLLKFKINKERWNKHSAAYVS